MQIQRAQPNEHQNLTDIAHRSKRHWNYPERWIELWRENLTIKPDFIAEHPVFVLKEKGKILGFYALVREEQKAPETWTLEHMWIDPETIGRGVGRILFEHLENQARSFGARSLRILSDPNATGFYDRMGAKHVDDHISELEGQPRVLPIYVKHLI